MDSDSDQPKKGIFGKLNIRRRGSFRVFLSLFISGLLVVILSINAFLTYKQRKEDLTTAVSKELRSVVNTLSSVIDGDGHDFIMIDFLGELEGEDEFNQIRNQLERVRNRNNLSHDKGSPLYTLKKSVNYDDSKELEFVVMSDPDENGNFFIGARYLPPNELSEIYEEAFQGKTMLTPFYEDEHGQWISAMAPIYNSEGEVVAILQADRSVGFFFSLLKKQMEDIVLYSTALIIFSMLISWPISIKLADTIIKPIRKIVCNLDDEALHLNEISTQVGSNTTSLNEGAMKQIESVTQTVTYVDKLIDQIARCNVLTDEIHEHFTDGNSIMREAHGAMGRLNIIVDTLKEAEVEITNIIIGIEHVAARSRILAVNAAIEAGKLGQAGAAFMVISDEFHDLAHETSILAKASSDKVKDSIAQPLVDLFEIYTEVEASLDRIDQNEHLSENAVSEIRGFAVEQQSGIHEVQAAITRVGDIVELNTTVAMETEKEASQLSFRSERILQVAHTLSQSINLKKEKLTLSKN